MGRKKKEADDAAGMGVVPTCPMSHALMRREADGEFECDVCHTDIGQGVCYFGCTPCDYSLCNGCYIKLATGELPSTTPMAGSASAADSIPELANRIDPDVAELCESFAIEDRIMLKLNETMKKREVTFAGDIEKLWEELKLARSPSGLLMAKIRQMEEGTFMGKLKPPKEIQRLIEKYRLDNDARTKLTGFICSRPLTAEKDLHEIERRLETSGNPSATVMTMMVKLHKGERLPEPFKAAPHRDFAAPRGGERDNRDNRDRRDRSNDRGRGDDRRGGGRSRSPRRGDYRRSRSRSRRRSPYRGR
eukprot:TRINITY_DN38965_c0_g1_i1.p2 TRINITY_DN38965_c0_g1~~TRINITY_DN38965_c0_g1_i1.p2  ORF type:complete len:305 (-),score=65.11 TRINITY_DN38965_c0_g1_i1:109-1023(-)